jgi:predicted RNase H-like HicB family nuclease
VNYHFKIHKEKNGYWAECCELDGSLTQGNTLEELQQSCKEALNLYLEEPADSKILFPLPNKALDKDSRLKKVEVDPDLALAVLLRNHRLAAKITQKQAAQKLGMKSLYSYQRLEKRSNPTLNIIKKIHSLFPQIELKYLFG